MTRRDQARAALTTPPARTGPASGPAIVGNTTRARGNPRRATAHAAPVPNAPAMPSPTWGCIEPCPTQTCPTHILTAHPYTTRRLVTQMKHAGLIEEHEATGPRGNTFTVLTATARGREAAHRAAVDAGHVPEQQTWTGLVKPAELSHDTAVYRAALDERARNEAAGGRVTRVRIDAELKATVATATEKARAEAGDRAADAAKRAAATELGLPMQDDRVLYPDAQLDIEDRDGMSGRVNVEVASDHYHAAAIAAKAGAGFAMHGSSRSATRKIARALARETDSGPGGGEPHAGRDGSVEL